jgi:hypothetical protein
VKKMKRSIKYLLLMTVAVFTFLFIGSAAIHSSAAQMDNTLVLLEPSCCDHGCQGSLMDEEDAEDAEDEEQDDKGTSSMEFDSLKME